MSPIRCIVVVAALAVFTVGASPMLAQATAGGDPARGRQVYERYCVQCHGGRGDGAGEVARWSQPKPRDFRQGVFKFTSMPNGYLPTTADLDRVIRDGLYGTRMPPFAALSKRERGKPIAVSDEPAATREAVTQGRELYEANCSKYHGDGSGNGASAAKLMVDDWGAPITPANLTLGRGKWARTARDIYIRAMGGINGTPMPESADALTPAQVWQVAHYVQALGGWPGSTPELRRVAAELPAPSATVP